MQKLKFIFAFTLFFNSWNVLGMDAPSKSTGIIVPTNNKGVTPVHQAAGSGNVDTLKAWIDSGVDPNILTKDGETPLHYAVKSGCRNTTKYLLSLHGIDINSRNMRSTTPLIIASQFGYAKAVHALLQAGADKDKANVDGDTPLIIAVERGHSPVVQLLLKAGADKDKATTTCGATPLFTAAFKGHESIAQTLLKAGANIDQPTTDGITPLHIAVLGNDITIVKLLFTHGANPIKLENLLPSQRTNNLELKNLLEEAEELISIESA